MCISTTAVSDTGARGGGGGGERIGGGGGREDAVEN